MAVNFKISSTVHGSKVVYVDKSIVFNESAIKMLDWLSIWGGADKVEAAWPGFSDGMISWEFSSSIPDSVIEKAIKRPINYCKSGSVYPLEVN